MTPLFSQAEKLALLLFFLAIPLFAVSPWLAITPLALFLLLCLLAPFFPQWGFFLPIISRGNTSNREVALTFDDGPSPASTPILLNLLDRFHLQATFFVVGKQAEKHPDLIAAILARGHSIGNHSWQHDNLLMLRSTERLRHDIRRTQDFLGSCGVNPLVFRPPAGITNPRLKSILQDEGLLTVTFSCRPFDGGNKKIDDLAGRVLRKLKPGDIILLHDLAPATDQAVNHWTNEINTLFTALYENAYKVQPLETLIERPVMTIER